MEQMADLQEQITTLKGKLADYEASMEAQKKEFRDYVELHLANQKTVLEVVIEEAKKEFQNVNDRHQGLIDTLNEKMGHYEARLEGLQGRGGQGGQEGKPKGYLPQKSMVPVVFSVLAELLSFFFLISR